MSRINISGLEIEYQLIGEQGAPAVALTPGGRFAKDTPGLPELAAELAKNGKRVLLWDRPNCGASDLCFDAKDESSLHANTLASLIQKLELGPTALAAGSAGSRISLMTAALKPELISHLVLWWISGGTLGLMMLAGYYCGNAATTCARGGMDAVVNSPLWEEQLRLNPRNRDILLSQEPKEFIETMQRWAAFFIPSDSTPVPGISEEDFGRLTMPTLILRNGENDVSHPKATSDWLHRLMPHSEMRDPPWPDDEWNFRTIQRNEGKAAGLFVNWPVLAPTILEFTDR